MAFRIQERAVTSSDYEDMSLRCSSSIQRSACTFRWTGSWRTAFLTIDRFGGQEVTEEFEDQIKKGWTNSEWQARMLKWMVRNMFHSNWR